MNEEQNEEFLHCPTYSTSFSYSHILAKTVNTNGANPHHASTYPFLIERCLQQSINVLIHDKAFIDSCKSKLNETFVFHNTEKSITLENISQGSIVKNDVSYSQ